MSTKTTFKRIALVAVAALGLGVLSVAPSSAVVSGLTVTVGTGGSASVTRGAANETTTAASVSVSGLLTASLDTITVSLIQKSKPSTGGSVAFKFGFVETTTSASTAVGRGAAGSLTTHGNGVNGRVTVYDSSTAFTSAESQAYFLTGGAAYVGAKFNLMIDTATTRVAGTYVFTAVVKTYEDGAYKTTSVADLTFTINDTDANVALTGATAIDPSKTTAILNAGAPTTFSATDSSVAVVATAASTNHASIQVRTYTADSNYAPESVTATITGAGVVCNDDGSVCGKSLTITGAGGNNTLRVRADGTAGTGSIVIKTTTVTFPAKTVTFFAKAAKTITLTVNKPVIGVGSPTDVIRATAKDADGNIWGGAAYIYAATAADALIAGSNATPAACTYNATYGYHECPVTGTAKGTANLKVIDASTVALSNVASDAAAVRVSTGVATTAKISFDKSTYGPGEKATVLVTILDADGLALPTQTVTAAFAATPTTNVAFSSGGDSLGADITLAAATSAALKTTAGSQQYTVYMPYAVGDVTISATGSTGLAAAGRVAVSATASVVNSSVDAATDAANEATDAANAATDAALAAADAADAATAAAQDASDAVAALSASVSKMITALKAQITSLTNLVIKIQKKVKA